MQTVTRNHYERGASGPCGQRYAVGWDGHPASPPDGLTNAEHAAWTIGHSEGLEAAFEAMEAYYRATGRLDPDPYNEATGTLAGHADRID